MFEINKIYNIDCFEFLEKLPDESLDLVLTDPPYGDGDDFKYKYGRRKYKTILGNNFETVEKFIDKIFSKLKNDKPFFIFTNFKNVHKVIQAGQKAGFFLQKFNSGFQI